jgi:hypothetical protein
MKIQEPAGATRRAPDVRRTSISGVDFVCARSAIGREDHRVCDHAPGIGPMPGMPQPGGASSL